MDRGVSRRSRRFRKPAHAYYRRMSGRWGIGRQLAVWTCCCAFVGFVLWLLSQVGLPPIVRGDGWHRMGTVPGFDAGSNASLGAWMLAMGFPWLIGAFGIVTRIGILLRLATWSIVWFTVASLVTFASGYVRSNGFEDERDPAMLIEMVIGFVWLLGVILMAVAGLSDHRRRQPLERAAAHVCPSCGANDLGRALACPLCGHPVGAVAPTSRAASR